MSLIHKPTIVYKEWSLECLNTWTPSNRESYKHCGCDAFTSRCIQDPCYELWISLIETLMFIFVPLLFATHTPLKQPLTVTATQWPPSSLIIRPTSPLHECLTFSHNHALSGIHSLIGVRPLLRDHRAHWLNQMPNSNPRPSRQVLTFKKHMGT